jgi:hypothetical protein
MTFEIRGGKSLDFIILVNDVDGSDATTSDPITYSLLDIL